MSFVSQDWGVGHHPIEVGTVRAPFSPNRLASRSEQHGYLIGSNNSGRLQLCGVYVMLTDGKVLQVKGQSKRPRLIDPYSDRVIAEVTGVTGRERSSVDHSVQWMIESRGANSQSASDQEPLRAPARYTLALDRKIRSEKGTPLRWLDSGRGAAVTATYTMRATLRDPTDKEILSAWTTYTSQRLGMSFRPLGHKMTGSFEGGSRTLSPRPLPVVALTYHLVLNHGRAPEVGEFVVEGSGT